MPTNHRRMKEESIGDRWDEEEDWGSLEDPEKAHTEPDDWNTDWSVMTASKPVTKEYEPFHLDPLHKPF
ncbi:hypothetical protein OYC64_003961 [Pagothenia borchgrevinki]|uniref:Uncharacterized protein n=1 Tax=Pagothenia borchgrevinki TaxID=8213 RepID=A0ABD2FRL6_PAGBO